MDVSFGLKSGLDINSDEHPKLPVSFLSERCEQLCVRYVFLFFELTVEIKLKIGLRRTMDHLVLYINWSVMKHYSQPLI